MIDKLKENWETALIGSIVGIAILCLCCCEGKVEEAPVVEPAQEEESKEVELTLEPANEVAEASETVANEVATETNEVKSSYNNLENIVKELEGKLNELVKILQSSYTKYEYDDNKFRWTYDFLKSREAFNEL